MERSAIMAHGEQYVLIVDPKSLRRAEIATFLQVWSESAGLSVIAATDLPEDAIQSGHCRLAIVNVGGTAVGSSENQRCIKAIRALMPETPLVVISDREEPEEVLAAFQAGARGFIPSSIEPPVALQALTFILGGGSFYPPAAILQGLQQGTRECGDAETAGDAIEIGDRAPWRVGGLTPRQQEVLGYLRQGKSNKVIARELNMQESTVKVHVRHIMRKLGAANRTQAALCAIRNGNHVPHPQDVGAGVTM